MGGLSSGQMTHSQEEFSIHLSQAINYLHSHHRHIKTWAALFIGGQAHSPCPPITTAEEGVGLGSWGLLEAPWGWARTACIQQPWLSVLHRVHHLLPTPGRVTDGKRHGHQAAILQ